MAVDSASPATLALEDGPVVYRLALLKRAALIVVLALAIAVPVLIQNPSQLNYAILVLMIAQAGVAWNIPSSATV